MRSPLRLLLLVACTALLARDAVAEDPAADEGVRVIALAPAVLPDPSRIPTSAARELGDALPSYLSWGDHPVRRTERGIEIATRSEARFDVAVDEGAWRVLELGSARWPRQLVVFQRDERWWVASAATLRGEDDLGSVELLDVDGDGAYDGDDDLVRTDDGAFRPHGEAERLFAGGALVEHDLVRSGDAHEVRLVPEPDPDWAEAPELRGWRALNRWRNRFGLAPQRLDRERVEGCRKHHAYWARNGYSAHAQDPSLPGHTELGARAGKRSSVWNVGDVKRLVDDIAREVLHRRSLLGDRHEGVGLTQGAVGSLVWGGRLAARSPRDPILVPGRGQRLVPTTIDRELPDPERIPDFYSHFRGYPIGVYYPRTHGRLRNARLTVTKHGARGPLPGVTFTETEPYHSRYPDREVVFVSRDPLPHGTWFRARFQGEDDGGEIEISWSFSTGNEPFPGRAR